MLLPPPASPTTSVSSTSRKLSELDLNRPEFGLGVGGRDPSVAGVGTTFSATDDDGDDVETEHGKEDDEDDNDLPRGERNDKIEFTQDKSRRYITFSKRKAEIMTKAHELSTLTGTQVLLLLVSESGLVYTYATDKLRPVVTQPEGKNLIQSYLNAYTGPTGGGTPVSNSSGPPGSGPGPGPPGSGTSSGEGRLKDSGAGDELAGLIAAGTEAGATGGDVGPKTERGAEGEKGIGPTSRGAPGPKSNRNPGPVPGPPDSGPGSGKDEPKDSGAGGDLGGAVAPWTETSVTGGDGGDSGSEAEHHEGDDGNGDDNMPRGERDIKIEFIQDKTRRHIMFSRRKAEIMKTAHELSTLTGTQVLLLAVSETGLAYTFATAKLQPLFTQPEGKNLIQACLNAPTIDAGPTSGGAPDPNSIGPQDQ
ncbi:transcription factor of the MADS box [Tulasnella sp. JGI-2019a]|nr:transcription factor of the MADS box [Tulasnella sp. JGI-2019a]